MAMKQRWYNRLLPQNPKPTSWLRQLVSGSFYKVSSIRNENSLKDIQGRIKVMRALAEDSQISTALSYYATDATIPNTDGQIIWAVPASPDDVDLVDIINKLLVRWNINRYARDHILELATIGNLYIPTTQLYAEISNKFSRFNIGLDSNTIVDEEYDLIPSTKLDPETVLHLYKMGKPVGYYYQEKEGSPAIYLPESAIIHFSLGGLLGDYTIEVQTDQGEETYDVLFANPLMEKAARPTQTLNLLEDATVLASLTKVVRFINVNCGRNPTEEEVRNALTDVKSAIEQQLSINTSTGDAQSYVNPQSPNNLIYLPKINDQDAVSITDLDMSNTSENEDKLLEYFQNQKLSVIGVPKEAMNFSSAEGLGGAGNVMSQRSALFANSLQRIDTANIDGWTDGINKYLQAKGFRNFEHKYKLKMNPITTQQSTINFEKRDAALSQATNIINMLKDLGVKNADDYKVALVEILSEALPKTGSDVMKWNISTDTDMEGGGGGMGGL